MNIARDMAGWIKKWLMLLFVPTGQGGGVPENKGMTPPVFLARQPLLRVDNWHDLLQSSQAGSRIHDLVQIAGAGVALHWGRMLLNGYGVQKNEVAAFNWFQRVAKQAPLERAAALNMLGRCFEHGWGVEADICQALLHYEKAAEQGDLWALFNLADCYRKGRGCVENGARAVSLYARAAGQGHVKSLNMLGLCYEEGNGVEVDHEKAADFFAKGAQAGDCWACFNHARLLALEGKRTQSLYWLECSLSHRSGDYCQTIIALFENSSDAALRAVAIKAEEMIKNDHPA